MTDSNKPDTEGVSFARIRDKAILEMLAFHARPAMVAKLMGVSERYVLNIAKVNGKTTRGNSSE